VVDGKKMIAEYADNLLLNNTANKQEINMNIKVFIFAIFS